MGYGRDRGRGIGVQEGLGMENGDVERMGDV